MTNELWAKAWAKETKDIDLTIARVAGRATKANPNKEDATWWNEMGPQWVENYISWRKANTDWKLWRTCHQSRSWCLPLHGCLIK